MALPECNITFTQVIINVPPYNSPLRPPRNRRRHSRSRRPDHPSPPTPTVIVPPENTPFTAPPGSSFPSEATLTLRRRLSADYAPHFERRFSFSRPVINLRRSTFLSGSEVFAGVTRLLFKCLLVSVFGTCFGKVMKEIRM